jgi:hypothetical protein
LLDWLVAGEDGSLSAAEVAARIASQLRHRGRRETSPDRINQRRWQMNPFLLQLIWFGRFGNRLHQYAYGATYARLTGVEFWLPSEWEGTKLFKHQAHPVVPNDDIRHALMSPSHGSSRSIGLAERIATNDALLRVICTYHPTAEIIDADRAADPYSNPGHPICNAGACFFSPALFRRMSRRHLQTLCEFSDEVTRLEAYKRYADIQGLYDVAHLRRGDIADAEHNRTHIQKHSVISTQSYWRAFRQFGFSPDAIEWVSDDYSGRWHVGRKHRWRGGWQYPTGSQYVSGIMFDWLADFLKLYFARTIFRANSSFSWWAATLSPTAQVFSPVIDKRHIYGVDGMEEIDVDFVAGNHPHWQYGEADLEIGD